MPVKMLSGEVRGVRSVTVVVAMLLASVCPGSCKRFDESAAVSAQALLSDSVTTTSGCKRLNSQGCEACVTGDNAKYSRSPCVWDSRGRFGLGLCMNQNKMTDESKKAAYIKSVAPMYEPNFLTTPGDCHRQYLKAFAAQKGIPVEELEMKVTNPRTGGKELNFKRIDCEGEMKGVCEAKGQVCTPIGCMEDSDMEGVMNCSPAGCLRDCRLFGLSGCYCDKWNMECLAPGGSPVVVEPLPAGWYAATDEHNRVYYHNGETSTWTRPTA